MKVVKLFFIVLFLFMGLTAQEKEVHKTGIEARILPLCVVDEKGNPVFDLKKGDLVLEVDGKKVDFQLLKYDFEGTDRSVDRVVRKGERVLKERVVFLLFDTMYNSKLSLLRAKDIACKYIRKAGPGNSYVVMSLTGNEGLKYILGPTKEKEKLCGVINDLELIPDMYGPNLFSIVGKDAAAEGIMQNDPAALKAMRYQKHFREQRHYISNIKRFSRRLGRLRYILKTIDRPRTVFLLSEGIARGAFHQRGAVLDGSKKNTALFNLLKGTMRSISATGAMFYAINPQLLNPETERTAILDSGDRSLQLLALEGGGEYISGAETSTIVESISNASSAYYEMAFNEEGNGRKKVNVKCVRKGVKVTTLKGIEEKQSYSDMDEAERKIYAVNVNFNRSWLVSKKEAEEAVCRYIKTFRQDGVAYNRLEVKVPAALTKKNADIFVIDYSDTDGENRLNLTKKVLKEKEFVDVPVNKDGRSFFVIVNRKDGYSLFGDGSWSSASWSREGEDFSFSQSSRMMKTVAGMVDIDEDDMNQLVRLNGVTVFAAPVNMRFRKIYKAGLEDAVLIDCENSYRILTVKADGRYGVSVKYQKMPENINDRMGAIHIGARRVNIGKSGKVAGDLKSFWLFYTRFRQDENFQRSRVVFPSVRNRYDADGKLTGSVKVAEKDWAFTTFEDSPPYFWDDPVVKGNAAYVTLKGEGANVRVIFEKKRGEWKLVRSESSS